MDIFLKGLVHRFCPKIELFFYGRFLQKSYQETSFLILQKEKNDFKQKKNGGLKKSQKMDIFQRGQSMDFVQKSKFLVWVFCTEILSEKMVFSYFGQKTNIVRIKNWSFNKGQKMKKNPKGLVHGFCPKIEISLFPVFHGNYVTKNRL